MKNKSVHSCRFVHHAKFHCIMTTFNKLFKIEFERGNWKTPKRSNILPVSQLSINRENLLSAAEKKNNNKKTIPNQSWQF